MATEQLGIAGEFDDLAKIKVGAALVRPAFIRAKLRICRTFAVVAHTRHMAGDRVEMERCAAESEKSYSIVAHLLPTMAFGEERQGFETEIGKLRKMLDQLPRLGN